MTLIDRNFLNRLLVLSAAIAEIIELEAKMVAEFRECKYELAGRREYLSFWLRTQSFFVTAKSLTDSKHFNSAYIYKTSRHWRLGIKALRNFFAHEVKFIPTLHSAVKFIPEEGVSVSLKGFVISVTDARSILSESIKGDFRKDLRKQFKGKDVTLSLSELKTKYRKHLDKKFLTLEQWRSRPNREVVVISNIATNYYMKIYELLNDFLINERDDSFKNSQFDSDVISLETKLESIRNIAEKVKLYQANNFGNKVT
jgi:hypothetical protein